LTIPQSQRLLAFLLPGAVLPATVTHQILAKAQGNPFFLEELVRALIDAGTRSPTGGGGRAGEERSGAGVAGSLQSVILSRVDRLDAPVRRILQTAAVIGPLFHRGLVGAVTQGAGDLDQALRELEDRQLIYEARTIPDMEYSFHHELTQETIYR